MSAIKEKIARLLALSNSPEEAEAKAALLKARELMAKHKLQPEEFEQEAQAKTVIRTVGVKCTKMTDSWAVALANVIAKRYCCAVYRSAAPRAKQIEVGFVGLEDDFEVCRTVYLYAYRCVKVRCHDIRAGQRDLSSAKALREMCNAFGWGFCNGLQVAFQEQEAQHQEWGLVMALPQPVHEALSKMGKPTAFGAPQTTGWRAEYAKKGFAEGKRFDPTRQLEPGSRQNKASA